MTRALALLAFLTVLSAHAQPTAPENPRLHDVHKIYLSVALRHAMASKEVSEQLVARLAASGRFAVVEKEAAADAVLKGHAGSTRSEKDGQKFVTGSASLRLTDPKSQEVLWTFEYAKGKGGAARAADRVADQFIKKLLEDAGTADAPR